MSTLEDGLSSAGRRCRLAGECLQNLLCVIQDPVLVLRSDRVVLDANEALLDAVGLKREEVIGKKCHEVSHRKSVPCAGPGHECPVDGILRGKPSAHALHEHCADAARSRYYDVVAYPVRDAAGELEVVLEVWRDISLILERQLEEKARKIKEDLARLVHEDKLISLGKLVASAVHEINNPLAAIHMFARVMLQMVQGAEGSMARAELDEMKRISRPRLQGIQALREHSRKPPEFLPPASRRRSPDRSQ